MPLGAVFSKPVFSCESVVPWKILRQLSCCFFYKGQPPTSQETLAILAQDRLTGMLQAQVFTQVKTSSFYGFSALSTINCKVLACRLNRHFIQPSRILVSLYSKTVTGRFVHSLAFCPHNLIFKADDQPIFPLQMKPNFFLPFFFFKHLTYLFRFFYRQCLGKKFVSLGEEDKEIWLLCALFFFSLPKKSGVESRSCHFQKDCLFGYDNEEPQHQFIKQASLERFGNQQKIVWRTRIIEMRLNKLDMRAYIQRSVRIYPLYYVFMDRKRMKTPHTACLQDD